MTARTSHPSIPTTRRTPWPLPVLPSVLPFRLVPQTLAVLLALGALGRPAEAAGARSFAFPSLRRAASASQTALGGPGACGEFGAEALRSNPAGLGRQAAASWSGGHQAFQSDLRLEWTGGTVPAGPGSFALEAAVLHAGSFEGWDAEGNATGSFRPFESTAAAGYGATLADGLRAGATARALLLSGPDSHCWGFACDAGIEKDLGPARLGLAARNLGPSTRGAAGYPYPLPAEGAAGLDWAIGQVADVTVSGLVDRFGAFRMRSGARVRAGASLALLVGGSYEPGDPSGERFVPRAGFELSFDPVSVAYAFASGPGTDATHHFSISLRGRGSNEATPAGIARPPAASRTPANSARR
ncbi:MAG: hypothetical protein ACE15D_05570 [Candidatus Eisenbacteria bacterium]